MSKWQHNKNKKHSCRRNNYSDLVILILWKLNKKKKKSLKEEKNTGYKINYSFYTEKSTNKKRSNRGKAKCYEVKLTRTNRRLTKTLLTQNCSSSEEHFCRKQNLTILSLVQDKTVNQAGSTRQDEQNTLATRTGKTKTLYTWGEGAQVETFRDQGKRLTGDTRGRASDLKREESYFSK